MKSNWPTKKLGEICQIRTGKKDVSEGNPRGKYPFFSCSRQITYSDTYSFDTEAILVAGNGDVGNTKIYKGKFEAYQRTYILDKFQENIKYIYYYLLGNLKRILTRSKSGSTMPYIRKGDLENFQISYPEDKTEQRKIVYVLDCIREVVEVQEKLIEKTKELKKSLMQKLLTKGIGHKEFTDTEIGRNPREWEIVKLGDSISLSQSGIWGDEPLPGSESFPVIRSTEITHDGKINLSTVAFRRISSDKVKKYCLQDGDILLVGSSGSSHLIGRAALFKQPCDGNFYLFSNFMIRIRTKKGVCPKFLYYFLNSPIYFLFLRTLQQTTTGLRNLSKKEISQIKFPLPPLPEQREIAEILQTVDQKIEIEQKKKDLYEELFKTMLNKLMTGEIRVNNIEF